MARDYEPDRRGMAALMRGREMQDVCMDVARAWVPRIAARTPHDSGDTAGTTDAAEDRMPDGTAGAKVTQTGASVQQHFGNARTRSVHHLDDAFGNGA